MAGLLFVQTARASYHAVILADVNTGRIIYSDRADDINYPASLTKLMTLYLTFNALERGWLRLDQELIVSREAAATNPVKLGLAAGSRITVENAIKAVAVFSANDMAVVLSENLIRGRERDFAAMMTEVAQEIGLKNTNFANTSGLPDADHVSSARDMALLAIALRRHYPQYWHFFSIPYFSYNGRSFRNGNGLLGSYPGADGMKTGFTRKSRYSLLSTARRGDSHLVAVVLGAPSRAAREQVSKELFDYGFGRSAAFASRSTRPTHHGEQAGPQSAPMRTASTNVTASSSGNRGGGTGRGGVQFGAFGTERAAKNQQQRVRSALGIDTYLERHNGLVRVRANMSESEAQRVRGQCGARGVECFVFR